MESLKIWFRLVLVSIFTAIFLFAIPLVANVAQIHEYYSSNRELIDPVICNNIGMFCELSPEEEDKIHAIATLTSQRVFQVDGWEAAVKELEVGKNLQPAIIIFQQAAEEIMKRERSFESERMAMEAYRWAGTLAKLAGKAEVAEAYYRKAVSLSHDPDAILALAELDEEMENFNAALENYQLLIKSRINQADQIQGYLGQAKIQRRQYNLDNALKSFEEAKILSKKQGEWKYFGNSISGITEIYKLRGDYENAIRDIEQVIKYLKDSTVDEREGIIADLYGQLGLNYWFNGDLFFAETFLIESIKERNKTHDKSKNLKNRRDLRLSIILDYSTLSVVYGDYGDINRAMEHINKAFDLYAKMRKRDCKYAPDWPLIYLHRNRGDIFFARYLRDATDKAGNFAKAKRDYDESLACAKAFADKEGRGVAHSKLGDLFYSQGDKYAGDGEGENAKRSYEDAEVEYKMGHTFFDDLRNKAEEARWHSVQGRIHRTKKEYSNALKEYAESLQLYKGKGKAHIADQHHYLGELLGEQGNVKEACEHRITAYGMYVDIGMNWKSDQEERLIKSNKCSHNDI